MRIFVRAKPQAKEDRVERLDETHYAVWVKAPAAEGKANSAIEKALALHFRVPVSYVQIVSGHATRTKKVDIIL